MLNKRAIQLLNILLMNDKTTTGTSLSEQVGVSTRTIRNDIQQINVLLKKGNVKVQANKDGYFIAANHREGIRKILNSNQTHADYSPTTPSERELYILLFLMFEKQSVSSNEIAEKLYVSKATAYGDIKRLQAKLGSDFIVNDVQGIMMVGSEIAKRQAVIKYLDTQETSLDLYWKTLELIDELEGIKDRSLALYQYIIQEVSNYKVYLADKEITSLTRILTLSAIRIKNKKAVELANDIKVEELTLNLVDRLATLFKVGFSSNEVKFIQEYLDAKRTINMDEFNNPDLEIIEIVDIFLAKVYEKYGFNFMNNETLKNSLYLHIKPMLRRLKVNEFEKNTLKDEIKRKFVLASEIAMTLLEIIFDKYSLVMSDSELSYIALHIASALEVLITPTRVLIISDVSTGGRQLIISKLENHFMKKIDIVHFVSITQFKYLEENNLLPKCDLIITTSFVDYSGNVPIVKINPLVFREDISSLKRYIHYYSTEIRNKDLFYSMFQEELFMVVDDERNYYECIRGLVKLLKQQEIIYDEEGFYRLVIERETTCSTVLDNQIAIPHASVNIAKKTKIAVAILSKPLDVDNKKVSVILLNAIDEHGDFQMIYTAIEKILEYPEITHFSKCRYFEDFMDIMKV